MSAKPGPRKSKRALPPGLSAFGRFARTEFFYRASASVIRGFIGLMRLAGRKRAARWMPAIVRRIAPLTEEYATSIRGIALAFPEKTEAERAAILRGAWDNVARVIVEFVFFEEVAAEFDPARPTEGRITVAGLDQFIKLRDDGKTAVIVVAHLANWEMLAVVARKFGLQSVISYRAPGNPLLADYLLARRASLMGTLVGNERGAAFEIAAAMERGEHLGMLVDQRLASGIVAPFMGRPAQTNPLAAKFARRFDCPVHGARAIRLPGDRLHLELTPEIPMPRDSDGLIDVVKATAAINLIVENWVREYPDQWFWLHDRWKGV